ncbi:MAG: hypothetical protein A3K19_17460 [Lentisphaerae bacterium RIFOXYB12_FULL_65_16]|nr:MAG: hypothetical protein A3K18_12495 [Lentisphaerae bacterium RIFOXYA12_64_32]OGV85588.1 MAG: hypothetical protein A3K19_17460 [Lentisphaerae bacterium RIFOXYB12_FULL_65_16]
MPLMRFGAVIALACTLTGAVGAAPDPGRQLVDDFSAGDVAAWKSSLSPDYFKGGGDRQALAVVDDPERGKVLRCEVCFNDPAKSEVVFITRPLEPKPRAIDVAGVRFRVKLTGPGLDPAGGLIVRLRSDDTSFRDCNVQEQLGHALPVNEWVEVSVDPLQGSALRNIWNTLKDTQATYREITFRLDDVDDTHAEFALLLDDITLVLRDASESSYTPQVQARPDDGRTRVLFLKHRAAGYYGIEDAIRTAVPPAETDTLFFRGLHFELFGFATSAAAVLAYDAIVMLDVDPFVLTTDQARWTADAVASGAHLLVFAGPTSLTHARDPRTALLAVLPVTFTPNAKDVAVGAPPERGPDHFLNLGFDPAGMGKVAAVQALTPKPGAEVPWTTKGQPLVVTMPFEKGRVTVVNAWAKVDASDTGDFFTSPLSDDLMRQLVRYALGRTGDLLLRTLTLPPLQMLGGGELRLQAAADGAAPTDLRLLVDGKPTDPPQPAPGGEFVLTAHLPAPTLSEEPHRLRVERLAGAVYDWRDFVVEAQNPVRLDIVWTCSKYTFAPGSRVEFTTQWTRRAAEAAAATAPIPALDVVAEFADLRSEYRWPVPRAEAADGTARFAGTLPNLASGEYVLNVKATGGDGTSVSTSTRCYVVDPLDLANVFPIMSTVGISSGGHYLDEAGVGGRIEDLLEHGFNTAAITGISNFRTGRSANSARLNAWAESYAQQRGMVTTYEYASFQNVGRNEKTQPCVFDPAYVDKLRQRLVPLVEVANRTPRLMTVKVTDEPHAGPGNMDGCEFCKAEFKRRYGVELREPAADDPDIFLRWAFADFIGAYVSQGYAQSAAIRKEQKGQFDLLLTYTNMLASQKPRTQQEDTLNWSRYVRWVDFDVYPYFYPKSQRVRMVEASFCMTALRDIARALGIPWGSYVELDDRNWPFQQNPKEASAECAYTAIAHGANYLNSFINTVADTGTQARPERWEEAGKALRAIRRIGPILNRMPAVHPPLAVLLPDAQQAIANEYKSPMYLLQALKAEFGDADVLHEEVAVEQRQIPYKALLLLKAEYLHADLVPLLKAWIDAGGVLVCDRLPTTTHRGEAIAWGFPVEPTPPADAKALIPTGERSVGKGRICFVGVDMERDLAARVEAKPLDPVAVTAYRQALRQALPPELAAAIRLDYQETPESVDVVEVGTRGNQDAILLTVVNHQPTAQDVTVTVPPSPYAWFVDLASMQPVPAEGESGAALKLNVPGRGAQMIAGYRVRPKRVKLEVATSKVKTGEELRYQIQVSSGWVGRPVRGGVLLEVEVRDPDGNVVTRYGGTFAPETGIESVCVPVPLNAVRGRYEILVTAPQIPATTRGEFTLR